MAVAWLIPMLMGPVMVKSAASTESHLMGLVKVRSNTPALQAGAGDMSITGGTGGGTVALQ